MSRSSMNPSGDPGLQSMFKDRFSNINTAKAQIERQREFDAARERLKKEFDLLDLNHDGLVTLEELQAFLDSKVFPLIYKLLIIEPWQKIWQFNYGGNISHDWSESRRKSYIVMHFEILMLIREEFVTKYLETRQKLNERLNEVYKKIGDHKRQRDEMA